MFGWIFAIFVVIAVITLGTAAFMLLEWIIMGIAYLIEIMFKGVH